MMKIMPDVKPDALFSENMMFRFWLTRTWQDDLPTIAFIGLNPSKADLKVDDNTVRKCQMFARKWGYGRLLMLNLFAFRATNPRDMWRAQEKYIDIIGGSKNSFTALKQYIAQFDAKTVVAAWGAQGYGRGSDAYRAMPEMYCLVKNADGSPKHPLYIPYSAQLMPWRRDGDLDHRAEAKKPARYPTEN